MEVDASRLTAEILDKGGFEILKWREGSLTRSFTNASILVADLATAPAGFLITLLSEQEVELHLAWTLKDFRRKGVFHALVQHQIAESSSAPRIFTRCYPKSTWAMAAFEKEGFAVSKQGDSQHGSAQTVNSSHIYTIAFKPMFAHNPALAPVCGQKASFRRCICGFV
jgi:hypothetical protein